MSSAQSWQHVLARSPAGRALREEVASLLEHRIHVLIERRECLIHSLRFANRLVTVLEDRRSDLFPLRHLRKWHYVVELIPERLRVFVVRQRRVLPRRLPWRQITSELVEFEL